MGGANPGQLGKRPPGVPSSRSRPVDPRLLRYAGATKFYLVAAIALGLTLVGLLVAQAMLLSQVIVAVFLGGATLAAVWGSMLALLGVFVGRALIAWAGEVAAHWSAARVKSELRERLLTHLVQLGPAYLAGQRTGELATVATQGIENLDAYFTRYLPQLILASLAPFAIIAWVWPLDRLSAVILAVTVPLIPVFMILIGLEAQRRTDRQWRALGLLGAHFLDVLQGLPTLRLFGRGHAQVAILRRVTDQYRATTLGVLRVAFLSALVLELVATLGVGLIAVAIGLRLLDGGIELSAGLAILILAPEVYLPLRQLGVQFHASMETTAAAQRIFDVLDEPVPPESATVATVPDLRRAPIEWSDVSFAYPNRPATVLDAVRFTLNPGEKVALVGPSGAGKSTVLSLLLRFVSPTCGQILIGGQPLETIPVVAWRAQLAWVPQQPSLLHGSIAENIRLGCPNADLAAVREAACKANAREFIDALPDGFETIIGERGARLSAGQRQRIALARAFLRDAPLLLLDEPTANLDVENEAAIAEAIQRLMIGRTVLLVAHRRELAAIADRVIVLDGGKVSEAPGLEQRNGARDGRSTPQVPEVNIAPEPVVPLQKALR